MKRNNLYHIKRKIMNMSCEEVKELQDFMTIGEQKKVRGESDRGGAHVISNQTPIQPPIELSPRMVRITEKNLSVCFKTKTDSTYMRRQKEILANIRRNY